MRTRATTPITPGGSVSRVSMSSPLTVAIPLPPCIRCPEHVPEFKGLAEFRQMLLCRMVTKVTTKDKREKRVFIVHKNPLHIFLVKAGRICKQVDIREIDCVFRQPLDDSKSPRTTRELINMTAAAAEPSILIEQHQDPLNDDHDVDRIYDVINRCRQHMGLPPVPMMDVPPSIGLKGLRNLGVFEKRADYTTPDQKVAILKLAEVESRTMRVLPTEVRCPAVTECPPEFSKQLEAVFADPTVTVFYVEKVTKYSHGFGTPSKRLIVITSEALWQLTPDDTYPLRKTVNRCAPLAQISELRRSDTHALMGIVIPIQYDILIEIPSLRDRNHLVEVMTAVNPHVKVTPSAENLKQMKASLRLNKKDTQKQYRRPVFASPLKILPAMRGDHSPSAGSHGVSSRSSGQFTTSSSLSTGRFQLGVERDGSEYGPTPTSAQMPAHRVTAFQSRLPTTVNSTADDVRRIRASAEEFIATTSSVHTAVNDVPPHQVDEIPVAATAAASRSAASSTSRSSSQLGVAPCAGQEAPADDTSHSQTADGEEESGDEEESDSFETDSDWENDFVRDTQLKDSSASDEESRTKDDAGGDSSEEEGEEEGLEEEEDDEGEHEECVASNSTDSGRHEAAELPKGGDAAEAGAQVMYDNVSPLEQLRMLREGAYPGSASAPPAGDGDPAAATPEASDSEGSAGADRAGPSPRLEVTEASPEPSPRTAQALLQPCLLTPQMVCGGTASTVGAGTVGVESGLHHPPACDFTVSTEEATQIVSHFYASRKKMFMKRLGQVEKLMNAYEGRESVLLRNLQIKYPDYDFFSTIGDRVERPSTGAVSMGTHSPLFLQNPPNFGGASPGRRPLGPRQSSRSPGKDSADVLDVMHEKEAQLEQLYIKFAGLVSKLEDISRSPQASPTPAGSVRASPSSAPRAGRALQTVPSNLSIVSDSETAPLSGLGGSDLGLSRHATEPVGADPVSAARTGERDSARMVELEFEMTRLRTRIEALTEENNDWAVKHLALQDKTKPKESATIAVQCGDIAKPSPKDMLIHTPQTSVLFGEPFPHSDSLDSFPEHEKRTPRWGSRPSSMTEAGDAATPMERKRIGAIRDAVLKMISRRTPIDRRPADKRSLALAGRTKADVLSSCDADSDKETVAEEPSDEDEASKDDGKGYAKDRDLLAQWVSVDYPGTLRGRPHRDEASSSSSVTATRRSIQTPSQTSASLGRPPAPVTATPPPPPPPPPPMRSMQWASVGSLHPQMNAPWSRAP
eukprot:TRINITY_DN5730_c1_g1_i1.p1 TRINITY_DN5730_c1_g1~~TRINITY_DN5730_c1_g1_i1.p1  ORF type:complete len:1253 (+),score=263.48 TRINITY_DN5730_c1_g1_i1:89-3847(+)